MANSFDVIILGGGPAGYVCAVRASQLGLSTALIERDKLGGVCVNVGCIPSKALLHAAYVANLVRRDARTLGVIATDVAFDLGAAVKHSRRAAEQNSKGVGFLMKKHGVTVIAGDGVVQPDRKVVVDGTTYTATKGLVLATGTRVKGLPQLDLVLDGERVISTNEALFLERVPASIAIIGAGPVGCEFADVLSAFGSRVTLIEMLPQILPLEDHEAAEALAKSFKKRKIDMLVAAKVTGAKVDKDGVTLDVEAEGIAKSADVEVVLVAAGRALNTSGNGFEDAGVQLTPQGFVQVDDHLRSTADGVYAIGDIAGPPMLAHKGSREGIFVAELIAGQTPHPIRYDNIPSVTYCHPEVASVGFTERQCQEKNLEFTIGRFPFSANGRARASLETEGFVKIIRDAQYGEILGAHVVASHASELIHEIVVARENEYTVEELDLAVHAHPTLSEAVAEAALDSLGRALNI